MGAGGVESMKGVDVLMTLIVQSVCMLSVQTLCTLWTVSGLPLELWSPMLVSTLMVMGNCLSMMKRTEPRGY